jgi:hypothetical protein
MFILILYDELHIEMGWNLEKEEGLTSIELMQERKSLHYLQLFLSSAHIGASFLNLS